MNCVCASAVTTAEVMPPYSELDASPAAKPDSPSSVIIDHRQYHRQQQQQQQPPEAVNNVSMSAVVSVAVQEGRPVPPTDVRATRRTDGSVLIQWTPAPASRDNVDHYVVEYLADDSSWLALSDPLDTDVTSYVTTASAPCSSVVCYFRLLSVSRSTGSSLPSNVATLDVDGPQSLSLISLYVTMCSSEWNKWNILIVCCNQSWITTRTGPTYTLYAFGRNAADVTNATTVSTRKSELSILAFWPFAVAPGTPAAFLAYVTCIHCVCYVLSCVLRVRCDFKFRSRDGA